MGARFQGISTDMEAIRAEMTAQFTQIMNAFQNLQISDNNSKNQESTKKNQESIKTQPSTIKKPEIEAIGDSGGVRDEITKAWVKKVELPTFDGVDPLGWISKADIFFELQQIDEDKERMRLTLICMEGDAGYWFKYWRKEHTAVTWSLFTQALLERFGDCAMGTIFERLKTIKQRGTVSEYIREFELLLAQAEGSPEEFVLGCFLGGLRKPIRDQVRVHDPKQLVKAFALARRTEEAQRDPRQTPPSQNRFRDTRFRPSGFLARSGSKYDSNGSKFSDNSTTNNARPTVTQSTHTPTANTGTKNSGTANATRNAGTRFLSKAEHARRWKESLCFTCGAPFKPGHRCPDSHLRMVILGDNEDVDDNGEIFVLEHAETKSDSNSDDEIATLQNIELSHLASMGLTQPCTMKLVAIINGIFIMVLMDSGATHNFISASLAAKLGLFIDTAGIYSVKLGNGERKNTLGKCKDLKIRMGD